ncbi:MAG: hypothetical protein ABSA30_03340, partial [Candidatus Aminicenantales bacterium]
HEIPAAWGRKGMMNPALMGARGWCRRLIEQSSKNLIFAFLTRNMMPIKLYLDITSYIIIMMEDIHALFEILGRKQG